MQRTTWDDSKIAAHIGSIAGSLGRMPTNTELVSMGRGDLANAITKRGGFLVWAEKLSLSRIYSDSDFGWDGEKAVADILESQGFHVERSSKVRWPFDLLLSGFVRLDVKTAKQRTYGQVTGWFYRIGKVPQADFVALHQADTGDIYYIPWALCPTSNVTLSIGGGKYAKFLNRTDPIRQFLQAVKSISESL